MLHPALNPYQFIHAQEAQKFHGRLSDMFEFAFFVSTVGLVLLAGFIIGSFLLWSVSFFAIRGLVMAYILAQFGNILHFIYKKWYLPHVS